MLLTHRLLVVALTALTAAADASREINFNLPDFPPAEEDPLEYTWRSKEARLQDILRLLRIEEELEGAVPPLPPLPPPRHRPHYRPPFSYSLPEPVYAASEGSSAFAVPPTDERFFLPPHPSGEKPMQSEYSDGEVTATLERSSPQGAGEDVAVGAEPSLGDAVITKNQETTTDREEDDEDVSLPQVFKTPLIDFNATKEDIIFVAVVAGSSAAVVVGVALLGYGWYRLHKSSKAAADVEYTAYGVTGPNRDSTPTSGGGSATAATTGDRRLAHSAQMYHYQLTKQQIIAMESNRGSGGERRGSLSEADSDDENEEGDYTVYECPGLATTGEMEVKNPLFQDDTTPAIVTGSGNANMVLPTTESSATQQNK